MNFGKGINPYAPGSPLYDLIMRRKVADDWTSQLAFMEEYDQTYGIFDHDLNGDNDPLAIIGMHPAEDVITGGRIQLLMNELMACRIPEITNTPLIELMNYPRHYLDGLLKEGRKARKKEDEVVDQITAETRATRDAGTKPQ